MLHGNNGCFRNIRMGKCGGFYFFRSQSVSGNIDDIVNPTKDAIISVRGLHCSIAGNVGPISPILAFRVLTVPCEISLHKAITIPPYRLKLTGPRVLYADIPCLDGDSNLIGRKAKFWIRYGGVSLDKRFVFGKSFYGEMGMLLTWGMNEIKVSQTAAASVPDFDFENENLSDYLDDYYNISSSINLKNYGIIAQPRISLGWRINDWLSIKAEAAYLHSVSMSGWEAEANHNSINITNKPDTNMDGLAFSIGPWLGF